MLIRNRRNIEVLKKKIKDKGERIGKEHKRERKKEEKSIAERVGNVPVSQGKTDVK